jgi:small subunit ribosomal protein S13
MVYFSRTRFKNLPIIQVLKTIYGVNYSKALLICRLNCVTPSVKFGKLPIRFIEDIEFFMSKRMKVDRELRQRHNLYLNELRENKTFKSFRKNLGLPSNGQRSKTNAKTAKKFGKKFRLQNTKQSAIKSKVGNLKKKK